MGLLGKIWVKLGLDNSELDKGFKDSEKSASGFQNSLKKIGGMMAAAFSVTAVLSFAKASIAAYNESALALTKLESVLKSTGGAAGLTSEQMQNFAADLQKVTKFEDDATIAAMAVLASFKGISGDVFKGVVTAAMDMSTVIGGDLQSNVYQLAKALERPAEGIQLLNRSTRAFSLAQIEDIKKLVAEGKTHEAQLSILAALEGKFGGAAKAAADTAAGAWVQLGNTIGDIMENIGSATEKSKGFAKSLNSYLTSMKNLWASDEVWTATKVYATFFSWANDNAVKAANAEAERKKKAIEDDAKLTAEKMKGINSVADADKALFDLGLRRYSSEEASFVAALENYKTKAIATEMSYFVNWARTKGIESVLSKIDELIYAGVGADGGAYTKNVYGLKSQGATAFNATTADMALSVQDANLADLILAAANQVKIQGKGMFIPDMCFLYPSAVAKLRALKNKQADYINMLPDGSLLVHGIQIIESAKVGSTEMLLVTSKTLQLHQMGGLETEVERVASTDSYVMYLRWKGQVVVPTTDKLANIFVANTTTSIAAISAGAAVSNVLITNTIANPVVTYGITTTTTTTTTTTAG